MTLAEDTECEVVTPVHRRPDAAAAARLGLADSTVAALTVRRLHGADPFQITNVSFPPEIGRIIEEVPELSTAGARSRVTVIGAIDARRPGLVMSADQTIDAVSAPPEVADHLRCAAGDPILKVDRLYFDGDGNAVESATSFFDPAYFSYRVTLRRRTS
jgi:DNA-binding GntR family transcriptional regulator